MMLLKYFNNAKDATDQNPEIMGFCNFSMFCCALLYVHSSFAIILMGKRELVALLSLPGVW